MVTIFKNQHQISALKSNLKKKTLFSVKGLSGEQDKNIKAILYQKFSNYSPQNVRAASKASRFSSPPEKSSFFESFSE